MTQSPLFREAALDAQRNNGVGRIIMIQPISYTVLALIAAAFALALVLFAAWGTYTRRVTVSGQLVPDKGLMKVYVPQTGTIVSERVTEGSRVKAGDTLFVLSSERQSSTVGETQAAISEQARARVQSLHTELAKTLELQRLDHDSLAAKIFELRSELVKLHSLIEGQRLRASVAAADYKRYQDISIKGYISEDQLTQRQADSLDQQSRLETLERDEISTRRNLIDAQSQFETSSIKYDNQIEDVQRNVASALQDLSESEARRELVVLAPETGIATAITAHMGQVVETNKPLLAIIPEGSNLQAELYAPSRAIGFIKAGDHVSIRYQAYAYQKFGQNLGTVIDVATTALSSAELTGGNTFAQSGSTGDQTAEPLYRIVIRLDSQTVTAYGTNQSLQAGMLLDADVMHEKLRLYEWALEPLYSLSGRL
jgi:membrane fusion protein